MSQAKKAKGVRIVDAETKETKEYYAKIIFMCASTFGSTQILLNSTSERFPEGMGNESGELGHNVMDHHFRLGASGKSDEFKDKFYKGRRPTCIYIPRFRNIDAASKRLTNQIRVYDSSVGQTVMIVPHKDVRRVAGSLTVYALREETWKHSFLREPFWQENALDGDRDNGQYITEFTVVGYAQRASAKRTGYNTSL